ncbi:MAG: hypothetical protein ACLSEK_06305 [Anaerostipes caccae]|uniref:hypothetical protein n=1 Tax=Anaerostipes caccae TaxID=105841 RepID=UPI00399184CA
MAMASSFFALFGLTFYAIFRGKELPELLKVMRSVSPVYYILGFGLIIVFVCCEAFIIYRMLRVLRYRVPKRHCILYSFVGFFFQLHHAVGHRRTAGSALLYEPG